MAAGHSAAPVRPLPRLILVDIDGKVAWEGDPGFKVGAPWQLGDEETYLDAPLADLIEKRRIKELAVWRARYRDVAVEALRAGDLESALSILREAHGFDWKIDATVLEAQTRLAALETAIATIEATAAVLARSEAEAALDTLIDWAELLEVEVDKKSKVLKAHLRAPGVSVWRSALAKLKPVKKKIEAGRSIGALQSLIEKLEASPGPFPKELAARLKTAADDEERARVVMEAERIPAAWLVREHFGW